MKRFEEKEIERTLRVLGGAKTPEGLEGRVLQRLAERRVEASAAAGGMGWRWVWVGAAVVAVSVGALVMSRGPARRVESVAVERRVVPAVVVPPVVVGSVVRGELVRPVRVVRRVAAAGPVVAEDVVVKARSFPAPEAPLTREERLLVRLAQRGEVVEVAALDPKVWAMRDAEEKVAVAAFFVKPKPKLDGNAPIEVILAAGRADVREGDEGREVGMEEE